MFKAFLSVLSCVRTQSSHCNSGLIQLSFHTSYVSAVAIFISTFVTELLQVIPHKMHETETSAPFLWGCSFHAVLCIEHWFTFRNEDCGYHCPVLLKYNTEFDSFLPHADLIKYARQ